jgi:hypothetical protein
LINFSVYATITLLGIMFVLYVIKTVKKTIYKVKKIIVGLIISATSFMNTVTKTYETMIKKNHQKEIVKIYKEKRVNKKSKY